jgi:hypothetical protein
MSNNIWREDYVIKLSHCCSLHGFALHQIIKLVFTFLSAGSLVR